MTTTTSLDSAQATGLGAPATQLKLASITTMGFAILIALGSHDSTDGPLRVLADLIFWPISDGTTVTEETRLLAAILGGVMLGWGLLYWLLVDALADSQPALLRRLVLTTIAVWFLVDSAASIASGGWLNVVGNFFFLAIFVLPARRL